MSLIGLEELILEFRIMKGLVQSLLVFAGATLASQFVFGVGSVQAQNVIKLDSNLVQLCKHPGTFDLQYQVGGECNFFHVRSFLRGKFNQPVVNNESLWTMLTTASGQPIGICYQSGAKVNPNLYQFQCPTESSQSQTTWQNSGNTGYYNNQRPTGIRTNTEVYACSYVNSTGNVSIPNVLGLGVRYNGSTNSGHRVCVKQNQNSN